MPSPFPGMDPFLERADRFPDLHHDLITFLKRAIQSQLPEPYYAKTGERVWVEVSRRAIVPDVSVARPGPTPRTGAASAGVATLEVEEPVVVRIQTVPHDETRQGFLEIFTRQGDSRRLVTAIEVLSPANKASSGEGRDLYLRKQAEIMEKDVHLVEIDLLRGGLPTTAAPLEAVAAQAGAFEYHVCIRRFDRPDELFVHPVRLEQRLPMFEVPLLPGDPTVAVDLQGVFDLCYDGGPWEREIDYANESPVPPLTPEQMQWVRGCLERR